MLQLKNRAAYVFLYNAADNYRRCEMKATEMLKYDKELLPVIYPRFYTLYNENLDELVFLDTGTRTKPDKLDIPTGTYICLSMLGQKTKLWRWKLAHASQKTFLNRYVKLSPRKNSWSI